MTEIREKVARAIAKVLYSDGALSDDRETGTEWILADAALSVITTELVSRLPGGWHCDPQEIADMIRDVTGVRDD